MGVADDLSAEVLAAVLPERPIRIYPALLSTEADAQAWARQGAPAGALVCANYQVSPRGRGGWEWKITPDGLAFSLVIRPVLKPEREGWLYSAATVGLADVLGSDAAIEWPDQVYQDEQVAAAVGIHTELGPSVILWSVVNVLIAEAGTARAETVASLVRAIESRIAEPADIVLREYLRRSRTIGRPVRARMIPLGPGGPEVKGKAVGSVMDGALLLETPKGNRVAVRPQHLGLLEDWTDQVPDDASAI